MSVFSPSLFSLTPENFWRWGRLLLAGAFALGLLLIVYLTWQGLWVELLFLPALLLGSVAVWHLFQHPLLNLCVVLSGFMIVADYETGFQMREVLYGLYLLAFLGHWFIVHIFFYKEQILFTAEEKALFLFLILLPCTFFLTKLFAGDMKAAISQGISLSLMALYFPIKEACVRYRYGMRAILYVVAVIGVFVALRNAINYQALLVQATRLVEISGSRVVTNDNLLMVASLFGLVLMIFARRWWSFLILLGGFLIFFAGLLFTQSRGYWLAFLFGAGAMFVLVDNRHRKRMVSLGAVGMAVLVGVGLLLFGDLVLLIIQGILERVETLATAATADPSLVNRLNETAAAWARVEENPVLGYGMGVPYPFYDFVHQATDMDDFVHNGYVSLWYKFGIWGLGLVLFFWARMAWRGVQASFNQAAPLLTRTCGLAAAVSLIAFTVSTLTSNPFYLKDTMFIFGVLMGLAGGAYHRARFEVVPSSPTLT